MKAAAWHGINLGGCNGEEKINIGNQSAENIENGLSRKI